MRNGQRNGRKNGKVRVAIVGVGNCASSFVQGVQFYRDASPKDTVPGLMHVELGGYRIRDIEFVAAFDIDKNKVGLDLADDAVVNAEAGHLDPLDDEVDHRFHAHRLDHVELHVKPGPTGWQIAALLDDVFRAQAEDQLLAGM